jgi:ubiquinone/menaquinone biosynthesis C-methylase UbiE
MPGVGAHGGWEIFQRSAGEYERWYATRRGRRADIAERVLLEWLLGHLPEARTVLEVGSGTGHFAARLVESGFEVVGLERAPAMVKEAQRSFPSIPFVLGDAHWLPFRTGAVDVVVFITTLEFLESAATGLREAVRVARRGIVAVVLNRCSPGGMSRRFGPQSRGSLLGQARDYSLSRLRRELQEAAGDRLGTLYWSSTLFPDGFWNQMAHVPLGDVIGIVAELKIVARQSSASLAASDQMADARGPVFGQRPTTGARVSRPRK